MSNVTLLGTGAMEVLAATPACSPVAKLASQAMPNNEFSPLFPIELVEKDFAYVVETADSGDARVPMTEAARAVFTRALEMGYGRDNITGVAQLYP